MKRREEVSIMLSALSAAGITENESVRCAVDCGLKMIRVKKFAERHDRDNEERLESAVSAVIQRKKETKP